MPRPAVSRVGCCELSRACSSVTAKSSCSRYVVSMPTNLHRYYGAGYSPGAPFLALFARSGAFRRLYQPSASAPPNFLLPPSPIVDPNQTNLGLIVDHKPKSPLLAKNARNAAPARSGAFRRLYRPSGSAPPNFLLPPSPIVDPNQTNLGLIVGHKPKSPLLAKNARNAAPESHPNLILMRSSTLSQRPAEFSPPTKSSR